MKLLFVNSFESPDYQNDMLYHGLVNTPGLFVYETAWPGYMLKGYPNPETLYGRGFTLYARMGHTPRLCPHWTIEEKIRDRFYDYVIYGSVARTTTYLDLVNQVYPKNKIVFVDGEDWPGLSRPALANSGIYFKRELSTPTPNVLPISFSIPEEHVLSKMPLKTKILADISPGFDKAYKFEKEQDYYEEYKTSLYGKTSKKAGFDCLRHYEILANGCIPLFERIAEIPSMTMTRFPKETVRKLTEDFSKNAGCDPNSCEDVILELLDYTKENLTTVNEAERFMEAIVS